MAVEIVKRSIVNMRIGDKRSRLFSGGKGMPGFSEAHEADRLKDIVAAKQEREKRTKVGKQNSKVTSHFRSKTYRLVKGWRERLIEREPFWKERHEALK